MEKGQLDQVLQSLSDGVAAIDGSGELTHYNAALMRMFGVVNVEKTEDLIKDPMVWKTFQEVFHTGESQVITYPMSGDKVLWISVSPVNTDEGVRTGVVGLFKDMTEMERTERMRREYVANISHELRTPLTAVRGLLEPLADGMVKNEEDKQRYYKIMLHEVMRLSRLITDMLTLSRLQAGTEYMELSRVNLEELINDVAMGYASTAQSKGITLDVDCDHTVDGLTDPDRIEQVLVILIDNAMRYTPEGGSIKIKLRSGERLIISVQDNGCGIPEKDLPHIFERFYKVDKSRGEGGTGLGLSIAKYIMEKLDENITVASELGKGTIFTFTVKKYVSNAIELGPAKESRCEKDRDKKEKPAEKAPDVDGVYEYVVKPALHKFASFTFEDICREFVREMQKKNELPFRYAKMGRWFGKTTVRDEKAASGLRTAETEIDILCIDRGAKEYLVGECKFKGVPFSYSEYCDTVAKLSPLKEKAKFHYALFSENGFDKKIIDHAAENETQLYTLNQIVHYA